MRKVCIIIISILALSLILLSSACTQGKQDTQRKQSPIAATSFPKKTFIDDYEVRFVPNKIEYPKALPALSMKNHSLSDATILAWFKMADMSKKPRIIKESNSDWLRKPVPDQRQANTLTRKTWDITGEETGILALDDLGAIRFYQPIDNGLCTITGSPHGGRNPLPSKLLREQSAEAISEREALAKANAYMQSHGGIPAQTTKPKAEPHPSQGFLRKDNKLVPLGKITAYSITTNRKHNGIIVEPDGILVTVDKLGVTRFIRTWHELKNKGTAKAIISPHQAIETAIKQYAPRIHSRYGIVVSQIKLIYHSHGNPKYPADELRPFWYFRITGEEARVDAYTGELVTT